VTRAEVVDPHGKAAWTLYDLVLAYRETIFFIATPVIGLGIPELVAGYPAVMSIDGISLDQSAQQN
jgi:hypothetical protein